MAEAVIKRLREALAEFRLRPRPRASLLRQAMEDLKKALPVAVDAANEKKKGRYEQEAYNLYRECDEALGPGAVSTEATAPKKRERGAESSEEKMELKCGLSQIPLSLQ